LLPDLLGKHLKVWTISNVIYTDIFCRAMPWARLMIRRDSLPDDLNTSHSERARAVLAGLFFLSIPTVAFFPGLWWVPLALLATVFIANANLYRFMAKAGGTALAVRGVLFHQFYYLYSSSVFSWCFLENLVSRKKASSAQAP